MDMEKREQMVNLARYDFILWSAIFSDLSPLSCRSSIMRIANSSG
jgi:hypothetical protein